MTERITPEQWRKMGEKKYGNKYKAVKTKVGDLTFDSKGEALRWADLQMLEKACQIWGLERQVKFPIEVAGVHICNYIMDYKYLTHPVVDEADGAITWTTMVAEDFKGKATPVNKLKQKLFKACYPDWTLRITTKADLGNVTLELTAFLMSFAVGLLFFWSKFG